MHYLTYLAEKAVLAHKNQSKLLKLDGSSVRTEDTSLVEAVRAVLENEVEHGRLHYNVIHTCPGQLEAERDFFPDLAEACDR